MSNKGPKIKVYKNPQGVYACLEVRGEAWDWGYSCPTETEAIESLQKVWKARKREIDDLIRHGLKEVAK